MTKDTSSHVSTGTGASPGHMDIQQRKRGIKMSALPLKSRDP